MSRILPILLVLFLLPVSTTAEHGDHLVIAEILIEGSAAKDEYVELYNPTAMDVNLEGWKLTKATASGNETNLVTTFPNIIIPAHGSLLICAPDAASCSGELADSTYTTSNTIATDNTVTLKNGEGIIIDRVGFGEAALREGSAIANPLDGQSLERKLGGAQGNGQDTDNNAIDFQTASPSPQNRTQTPRPALLDPAQPAPPTSLPVTEGSAPPPSAGITPATPKPKIKINEFYPNPPESDFGEFIELKNDGEVAIDLHGWSLRDPNGVSHLFDQLRMLNPGTYATIPRSESGLALRNSGGKVELFDSDEKRHDSVSYDGPVAEGVTYARDVKGKFQWTTKPTPGNANEIFAPNRPPIITIDIPAQPKVGKQITLDASDTNDPDGDPLTFVWSLPDGSRNPGPRFTILPLTPTKLAVTLTVSDDHGNEATTTKTITFSGESAAAETPHVRFSEIYPNPEGRDVGEWLELENTNDRSVSLAGYRITIGSKDREFPEGVALPAHGFVILAGPILKLPLTNSGGTITLANPQNTTIDSIAYPKLNAGISYARQPEGTWALTELPTPAAPNFIQVITAGSTPKQQAIREITPDAIWDFAPETLVKTEGVVIAPPGTLGAYRFAVTSAILETRQPLPVLAIGDRIEITGTIRERDQIRIIFIGKADTLRVIGRGHVPEPETITADEFTPDKIGSLVRVEGIVVTRRGQVVTLTQDETEFTALLPKTLDTKFEKDTPVALTGILTRTPKSWRITTRTDTDINKLPPPATTTNDQSQTTSSAGPITIPLQRPLTPTSIVLIASLVGLALIGLGTWLRERPSLQLSPIYASSAPLTPHVETVEIPLEDGDRDDRA